MEQYLCQSLPYLEDPQPSVRETAVRFIGELQTLGARLVPAQHDASPGCCACSKNQPSSCQSPAALGRAWASRGSVSPCPIPAHTGRLTGGSSSASRPPGVLHPKGCAGLSPAQGRRVHGQAGKARWELCCWQYAGLREG